MRVTEESPRIFQSLRNLIKIKIVGFEAVNVVVIKNSVFRDTTPRSEMRENRCLGGTYSLHFQGKGVSKARNQHGAGSLLGLLLDPEDGEVFLRNVG